MQCAGAGIYADTMRGAAIGGELFLKCRYLLAEYELAAFQDVEDCAVNLVLDAVVLGPQVHEGNHAPAPWALPNSVKRPCCSIDAVAASRIRTTNNPASPSVNGRRP